MDKTLKKLGGLLTELGLRRTSVRLQVLQILSREKQPLTAPQILDRMPRGTDHVTIYRTLNTLTDKNLLHRVRGDEQTWRYEMIGPKSGSRHEHAHFVCDECGTVECLTDAPLPEKSVKKAGVRPGYRIDYSEVLMHGACPECRH
ncbi:MAG TPA: transcriptional repressor [Tepidisphaeraceae bacterium]|nr:transcriptional repressor [Tepidisphaeraceae bacterium]